MRRGESRRSIFSRRVPRLAAIGIAIVLAQPLAGCFLRDEPIPAAIEIPPAYRAGPRHADAALPSVVWWRGFGSRDFLGHDLRLVARLYGVADFERRAAALVEELELRGKERSLPGELSRGMRQKVVIACGLVREATTLLFDEPLTGLDPLGIRRMRETIVARGRAGAAILLSSHLLHLVEEICTRVIIMDRGRKIADGTFDELRSRVDLAEAGSNLEQIFLSVTGRNNP